MQRSHVQPTCKGLLLGRLSAAFVARPCPLLFPALHPVGLRHTLLLFCDISRPLFYPETRDVGTWHHLSLILKIVVSAPAQFCGRATSLIHFRVRSDCSLCSDRPRVFWDHIFGLGWQSSPRISRQCNSHHLLLSPLEACTLRVRKTYPPAL